MKDRDCEHCNHRKPDGCESWECNFEPKKELSQYLSLEQRAKNMFGDNCDLESCVEELRKYRKIGTVEELKKIKEKDIAKPVIKNPNGVFCPVCCYWISHRQYAINVGEDHPNRCEWCGQKLDWEETDED